MAGLSYMQRRSSGIYEFRKRLPQELAGKPAPKSLPLSLLELVNPTTGHFKRELTVSLGTKEYTDAKRRDIREARRVMDLMDLAARFVQGAVRHEELGAASSMPVQGEIEASTIAALLKDDEDFREDGDARRHLQTPEERAQWPDL